MQAATNDAIIILHAGDLGPAIGLASGLSAPAVYLFDPALVDLAGAGGLANIKLLPFDQGPDYRELDSAARAAASAAEAALERGLGEVVPGLSLQGWQHLNLYYLFMMLNWYGPMWDALGEQLRGKHVHIFMHDQPASYYFNCFIPSLQLMWRMKTLGIEFSAYTYGDAEQSYMMPDLGGSHAGGTEQVLAHLPTCMYDHQYFCEEIIASGKHFIDIEAPHFNVPVPAATRISLVPVSSVLASLPAAERAAVELFGQRTGALLEQILAPHIIFPEYCRRQARHLALRYQGQLLTYLQLNRYFSGAKPSKLLLSDHDAGLHGPLISFASKHYLPVLLLPHAKTSADIEFGYANMMSLTHPVQGRTIFDAQGRSINSHRLQYPETFTASSATGAGIGTISLLLNAQSLNGVYFTAWRSYLNGLHQIMDWCRERGIVVKIRCKPSYTLVRILARELGIDGDELNASLREPMEDHARSCDLCLMYDTPTSALLHFLKNGIPILNPVVEPLTAAELTMSNQDLVPQESVATVLDRLAGWHSDPLCLYAFRNEQFARYIGQFRHARALRTFL